jgi:hypothetical protein
MAPARELLTPADRAVLELGVDRFPDGAEAFCIAADEAALRYAVAAGASRVDVLSDLQSVRADWVLVGPGSLADYGDWLPAVLAEQLAAALVFDVQDIVGIEDDTLVVLRDLGAGDRDELAVTGPAVLVFTPQLAPTRYVSRFRQRTVRIVLAPSDEKELPNPLRPLIGDWETMRPRTRLAAAPGGTATAEDRTSSAFGLGAGNAASRDSHQPLQADPETCAAHLLRYLSHHRLLPRRIRIAPVSFPPSSAGKGAGGEANEVRPFPSPPAHVPEGERSVYTRQPAPLTTRTPRLQGELPAARQARRPRRVDAPPQTASPSAAAARRPRRPGPTGPERQRGPRPHAR